LKIVVEEGGTISGHVVDGKRKPVTHCWIYDYAQGGEENQSHDCEGKPDGSFTITGLGAGPYDVHVQADEALGNFQPKKTPQVAVGTKDLEIVLDEGLSVSGVVVDEAGKPVAQMAIEVQRISGESHTGAVDEDGDSMSAWTDGAGKFTVAGLSTGTYRVLVARWGDNQGYVFAQKDPVQAGAT